LVQIGHQTHEANSMRFQQCVSINHFFTVKYKLTN